MLIKSFNSNTLDDSKNFEIKEMVFFDRHSLPYQSALPMRTNIIFLSPTRIYLYDYLTDAIKQINEKDIEQKTIRKVAFILFRFAFILKVKFAFLLEMAHLKYSTVKIYTARTQ